jgi:hypothetical protein
VRRGFPAAGRAKQLSLRPDSREEGLAAHDVQDAGEIVGEDVQRHLACDTRQRPAGQVTARALILAFVYGLFPSCSRLREAGR